MSKNNRHLPTNCHFLKFSKSRFAFRPLSKKVINKYFLFSLNLVVLNLIFSLNFQSSANAIPFKKKLTGTAAVVRVTPTATVALTTIDQKISVEEKAKLIIEMIERAPQNKEIYIVIEPDSKNRAYYSELLSLIDNASQEALKTKGVRVQVKMVNLKLATKIKEYLEAQALVRNSQSEGTDNFVMRLAENQISFSDEDAPKDLVTAINNETSYSRMWLGPLIAIKDTVKSLKDLKVGGLAITTALVAGVGMPMIGPSHVFASDGYMSKDMLMIMSMNLGLAYFVSRHEDAVKNNYELFYDILRAPWQGVRALFLKALGRNVYLPQANSYVFRGYQVASSLGVAVGLQAAYYKLLDGSISANDLQMIIQNGLLIGAASAPYTYLTHKLKTETNLPANIISHLRVSQIALIGFLVAALPPLYGLDASIFDINTNEEAILLGMGATGLFLNYKGVELINKLDQSKLYRYTMANLQAITEIPTNFLRKLFGRESNEHEFMTWAQIGELILNEAKGLEAVSQDVANTGLENSDRVDQVLGEGDQPIFYHRERSAGSCLSYLSSATP